MERLKVQLTDSIAAGTECTLTIVFSGSMLDKIVGLYRSAYKDADGNDR